MDIENLEKEFKSLSKLHKRKPTPDTLAKLKTARIALNLALNSSAEKHLRWVSGRFYLRTDKIGPKLAAKPSPKHRIYSLPKMKSLPGSLTQNPKRILEAFHSFYANLYTENSPSTPHKWNTYLGDIPLPKLSDPHYSILDSPILEGEVREVIKDLKKGSAPGPNGFSSHYYKTFVDVLSPYLVRFFNSLSKGSPLDSAANLAYIYVIPKPGKDPSKVCNYR